jgi:hypothetical protein
MDPDLISKDALLAAGWTARQIEAALDEPDEVGPSGHWLNTSGKPYYRRERVEIAAYRIGLSDKEPLPDHWDRWISSERPTSLPEFTLDFHRLADECVPQASRQFGSLRLTHPVLGRRYGTKDKEAHLIVEVLSVFAERVCGVRPKSFEALGRFLYETSFLAAERLGPDWPINMIVRPARRASYISKATGMKSVKRYMDALSLIHAGLVLGPENRWDLIALLISSPRLRFDRRSLRPLKPADAPLARNILH